MKNEETQSQEMNKKRILNSQILFIPLFWGSLWGIAEATLGHLLHIAGIPGLAGIVMFPLGLYFMTRSYIFSGQRRVIFFTALVAASFKLLDLFFPVASPFVVVNPAIAILFESLVVILVLPGKGRIHGRFSLAHLLKMAVSWRVFYTFFVLGLSLFFPIKNFLNLGLFYTVNFFLWEGLASGLMAFLFQSRRTPRSDSIDVLGLLSKSYISVFVFLIIFSIKFLV